MAENVGLGLGESASVKMLPEDCSCRPKARAGPAARISSSVCCALTCCLVSLSVLAGLTTYLLIGQLRAQGEACVPQAQSSAVNSACDYGAPDVCQDLCGSEDSDARATVDREKPRAHLTVVKQTPTQTNENQFPALHWEHELGLAFTKNRMNYTNRFLVIPETGDYFVYSQVTFRGTTSECGKNHQINQLNKPDSIIVVVTKVTDSYPAPTQLLMGTKSMCELGSSWFQPIYLGAMFSLQEGDKLIVNVSDISLVDYTKEDKTFFGAFLL
ncbi:Tumor necrosis factor ligand superfamily member 15 [Galemys pyrenaicus]|uniref:Tumor necrosis factor ligand superfamily member 15 n=1 Tax=Galemys pyrenaicus TaxID=202257 RepID=A0A8J6DS57_GALPY|nr:Tumor necrosis factor ligand superfamily member 15 [Galemys pyrenaicus]